MRIGPLTELVPAGLVGKLPAHGDFVRRGADGALVARLDRWLGEQLGQVDATLLDERLPILPTWSFLIRRESDSLAGVMIASRDGVGRFFPLLCFAVVEAGMTLSQARGWCISAADTLSTMRDAHENAAAVAAALSAIPVPAKRDESPLPPGSFWWTGEAEALRFADLPAGDDFVRLLDPERATA